MPPPLPTSFDTIGGAGADSLTALPGGSRIRGLGLGDTLTGLGGADALVGDEGNDLLRGGGGADTLFGRTGDDRIEGQDGNDVLVDTGPRDFLSGGLGNDTLWGAAGQSASTLAGGEGQDVINGAGLLLGEAGHDRLSGHAGRDTLRGGDGDDSLIGGFGADRLEGGAGNDLLTFIATDFADTVAGGGRAFDTLVGGAGNDVYVITAEIIGSALPAGYLVELAGGGHDRAVVLIDTNFILPDEVEDLDYRPLSDISGNSAAGNAGNNRITGRSIGTDFRLKLEGLAGNDTIANVGPNISLLLGGAGNDALIGNVFDDTLEGGIGRDRLNGQGGRDVLIGDDTAAPEADVLRGGADADRLVSRGGGDLLDGGTGLDVLELDLAWRSNALTLIVSYGIDAGLTATVAGDASRVLNTEIFNLTGGASNDTFRIDTNGLLGQADTLFGGGGRDTLSAGAGDDMLRGGNGDDSLSGEAGNDSLSGDQGNDTIFGGNDADTLNGGVGRDLLFGGGGNDLLIDDDTPGIDTLDGDDGNDTIFSGGGEGLLLGGNNFDRLVLNLSGTTTAVTFIAGSGAAVTPLIGPGTQIGEFEVFLIDGGAGADRFSLAASAGLNVIRGHEGADSLVGGSLADTLDGGAQADTLDGGDGADRLVGGTGDDLYFVDVHLDQVIEQAGGGRDEIRSTVFSYTMPAEVEHLVMLLPGSTGNGATGDDLISGSAGSQTLSGADGADTLLGEAGLDVLEGGRGQDLLQGGDDGDTLHGGEGDDRLEGGAGNDLLEGQAGADTLSGGAGADLFRFSAAGFGADLILDFVTGEDRLQITSSGFAFITEGSFVLLAQEGTAPVGFGPQFILDTLTDRLSFDEDGQGGIQALAVARFAGPVTLTVADFMFA